MHYSAVPKLKRKLKYVHQPLLMTRSSSRSRQPMSRVNLTPSTMPTSGKSKNFSSKKKLKLALPKFLLLPKKSELPRILGGSRNLTLAINDRQLLAIINVLQNLTSINLRLATESIWIKQSVALELSMVCLVRNLHSQLYNTILYFRSIVFQRR